MTYSYSKLTAQLFRKSCIHQGVLCFDSVYASIRDVSHLSKDCNLDLLFRVVPIVSGIQELGATFAPNRKFKYAYRHTFAFIISLGISHTFFSTQRCLKVPEDDETIIERQSARRICLQMSVMERSSIINLICVSSSHNGLLPPQHYLNPRELVNTSVNAGTRTSYLLKKLIYSRIVYSGYYGMLVFCAVDVRLKKENAQQRRNAVNSTGTFAGSREFSTATIVNRTPDAEYLRIKLG